MKKIKQKTVTQRTEHYNGQIDEFQSKMLDYNVEGNLIREEHFNPEGSPVSIIENEYDAKNKLLHKEIYFVEESTKQSKTYTYENELLTKVKLSYELGGFSETNFVYDEKGKIIEESEIDDEDGLQKKITYEYDADYLTQTHKQFDADNQLESHIYREKDENGNQVLLIDKTDAKKIIKATYSFDAKNKITGMDVFENDRLVARDSYSYNEENNLEIKVQENFLNRSKSVSEHTYNSEGKLTELKQKVNDHDFHTTMNSYNEDGVLILCETWDKQGPQGFEVSNSYRHDFLYFEE